MVGASVGLYRVGGINCVLDVSSFFSFFFFSPSVFDTLLLHKKKGKGFQGKHIPDDTFQIVEMTVIRPETRLFFSSPFERT